MSTDRGHTQNDAAPHPASRGNTGHRRRRVTLLRLLAGVALALVVVTPALATSHLTGPSWVPAGYTGCWEVPDWPYDVDVDWGDGKSSTNVEQPFCHSYRSKRTFIITATRYDIDVGGTVVLGTMDVSTQVPTLSGPYEPGTTNPVEPQVGQVVEFRFSIPGPYDTLSVGIDGNWSPGSGDSFQASFPSEGSHTAGIRLNVDPGWTEPYTLTTAVTVAPAPTTTTTTITTTTTTPPSTTVPPTTAPSTTLPSTTTTSTNVGALDDDDAARAPLPGDLTDNYSDTVGVTGSLLTVDPEGEEEEDLLAILADDATSPLRNEGDSGSPLLAIGLLVVGGIGVLSGGAILFFDGADALFGRRTGVKDSHDRYANQAPTAAESIYVDDMAVPDQPLTADGIYVDDMAVPDETTPTAARNWIGRAVLGLGVLLVVGGGWQLVGGADDSAGSESRFDLKPGYGSLDEPEGGTGEMEDPGLAGISIDEFCADQVSVPGAECEALGDLFIGGLRGNSGWQYGVSWFSDDDPCDWNGIHCEDGHVSLLSLERWNTSGPIPEGLRQFINLTALYCDGCGLTGPLPTWLGSLPLETISLARNDLSGQLPSEIAQRELTAIFLSDNDLMGAFPADWGERAPNLEEVMIAHNRLSGTLTGLDDMSDLRVVNLCCNDFDGPLPRLPASMDALLLGHNRFSGPLWTDKMDIRVLDLSHNELTGSIPSGPFQYRNWDNDNVIEKILGFEKRPNLLPRVPAYQGTRYFTPHVDLGHNALSGSMNAKLLGFHGTVDVSFNELAGEIPFHEWFPAVNGKNYTNGGRIYQGQSGCLTARDEAHAQRLADWDPLWNDGC